MTQQDAACCALVVMPSVTEESSSTSLLLSTEQLAGFDPVPIDRVSNVPDDVGPTEVTDHSILMDLGLVDRYGRPSRDMDPVEGQREARADVGEPGYHPREVVNKPVIHPSSHFHSQNLNHLHLILTMQRVVHAEIHPFLLSFSQGLRKLARMNVADIHPCSQVQLIMYIHR